MDGLVADPRYINSRAWKFQGFRCRYPCVVLSAKPSSVRKDRLQIPRHQRNLRHFIPLREERVFLLCASLSARSV